MENNTELPVIFENIENASKSTATYIKENYPIPAVVLAIFCLFFIFLAIVSSIFSLLFIPIFILFCAYGYVRGKIRHAFMQQFAKANNFTYRKKGIFVEVEAPYLQMGHNQRVEDVVVGNYQGFPINFFNFTCTIGNGKEEKIICFTVCKIQYRTSLPRIFLNAHHHDSNATSILFQHNDLPSPAVSKNNEEIIYLEGDFNKYFTLYVPKGYEIEALQIFAPDIMAKLIDKSKKFSLEFMDDHLYIYSNYPIETKEDLISIYELAQILIVELAPTLERLKH